MLLNYSAEELLRVPWTARRSNQSILNQPWILTGRTHAETELPVFWPPDVKCWLFEKDPDAGKDWGQDQKQVTEDEMVVWHHWLSVNEFQQIEGRNAGQGRLTCYTPWSHRVWHKWGTEQQQHSIVYMYHSFCILSSIDEHLGCYCVLIVANSFTTNIGHKILIFRFSSSIFF